MTEFIIIFTLFLLAVCFLGFTVGNNNAITLKLLSSLVVIILGATLLILKANDFYTARYFTAKEMGYEIKNTNSINKSIKNNIVKHKMDIEKEIIDEKYKGSKW